jgi:hypothetical protein
MARPEIQAKLSRNVGTAPTVRRELTDLTGRGIRGRGLGRVPDLPALRPLRRARGLGEPDVVEMITAG